MNTSPSGVASETGDNYSAVVVKNLARFCDAQQVFIHETQIFRHPCIDRVMCSGKQRMSSDLNEAESAVLHNDVFAAPMFEISAKIVRVLERP